MFGFWMKFSVSCPRVLWCRQKQTNKNILLWFFSSPLALIIFHMVGFVHPLMPSAELSSYGLDFGLEKGVEYSLFQSCLIFGLHETWITPVELDGASSKQVPIYFSCLWRLMWRRLAFKLQKMFCGPWNLTWLSAWMGNYFGWIYPLTCCRLKIKNMHPASPDVAI